MYIIYSITNIAAERFNVEHGAKLCKGVPYDVLIVRENLQYITLYYILSDTNATRIYILS
jgi:hypothetical protein